MLSDRHSRARRGLTLIETAAAVASLGLIGTVGVAGLAGSRRADAHANCAARLAAIGAGNGQFALAHNDRMFGLTWERGGANSQYADLNALQASSANGAHAAQVIDILRRRGRPDMPVINNWLPDPLFATTVLVDFQNRTLADPFNLCPSDDNLNKWRRWPAAFDEGRLLPNQPTPGNQNPLNKRVPYSASYSITTAAWDTSQSVLTPAAAMQRINQQGVSHSTYNIPGTHVLGPSALSLVAFPSQRSQLYDTYQRHLPGTDRFFMYDQATLPILFFDGSVRVKTSIDARGSWIPQFPTSAFRTTVTYSPNSWEPPTSNGMPTEMITDPYRFTRDGLLGWDFEN